MATSTQIRYPNQLQIVIRKTPIREGDYYVRIRKDVLRKAARNLKAGATKLYLYLADNMDGYKLNLSPSAAERDFGIKKTQFYNARDELIKAGYLYQPDSEKNN